MGSGSGGTSQPCCQAKKCTVDLTKAKRYHRRHKVCKVHSKAPIVIVAGLRQRFCQQCSRLKKPHRTAHHPASYGCAVSFFFLFYCDLSVCLLPFHVGSSLRLPRLRDLAMALKGKEKQMARKASTATNNTSSFEKRKKPAAEVEGSDSQHKKNRSTPRCISRPPMFLSLPSLYSLFLLSLHFFLLHSPSFTVRSPFQICGSSNYTANSDYESNLSLLLHSDHSLGLQGFLLAHGLTQP